MERILLLLFLSLNSFVLFAASEPQTSKSDPSPKEFTTFKQGLFTFLVDPNVNLSRFSGKISLRKISHNLDHDKMLFPSTLSEPQKNLFWKFFVIYRRVQNLLNMHPTKQNPLTIYIFNDMKTIREKLKNHLHQDAPAFYNTREKALYLSSKDFDEYILAHELAHVIISNYFLIEPPAQTQEILATYCDSHLKDEPGSL